MILKIIYLFYSLQPVPQQTNAYTLVTDTMSIEITSEAYERVKDLYCLPEIAIVSIDTIQVHK